MEAWQAKFVRLRRAHGWSLAQAADQFVAVSTTHTFDQAVTVRRQILRWERGVVERLTKPTRQAIAGMFRLPFEDFWPTRPAAEVTLPDRLATDELSDLITALHLPRVGQAHLDQAEAEVERLCTAYASQDAKALTVEVNDWLRTLGELVLNGRVGLAGHAQAVRLTGWLALLRSCLMWDQGRENRLPRCARGSERYRRRPGGSSYDGLELGDPGLDGAHPG